MLLVRGQIEIGPVRDALDLAEVGRREREPILDVARSCAVLGIVRELVFALLPDAQRVSGKADALPPRETLVAPEPVPGEGLIGVAEELDFHLFEFARTKREVTRRDLVAEGFAD